MHFDPQLPVVVEADASPYGIGTCISHVLPDDSRCPVFFVSRALTSAERSYSQADKEGLATLFGVRRLHQFVFGRHFILRTDQKPLGKIFGGHVGLSSTVAARLQRWALILSRYYYHIEFIRGCDNVVADCLSRLPVPLSPEQEYALLNSISAFSIDPCGDLPVTAAEVATATREDPCLSKVLSLVRNGWSSNNDEFASPYFKFRDELSIEFGCVLRGSRVVIPALLRESLLRELHSSHFGISRMKAVARSFFWWRGIDDEIATLCSSSDLCQQNARSPSKEQTHQWVYPSRPFERIHIDYAEFEGRMFFLVVDAFPKWPFVFDLGREASTTKTVLCLLEVLGIFGIPDVIVSDSGPQFTSNEFRVFSEQNGIRHNTSPPYHPATNGQVERMVQELKKALKTRSPNVPIAGQLSKFLFAYRSTTHSTTKESPASLVFKKAPITRFSFLHPCFGKFQRSNQEEVQPVASRGFSSGDTV